MILTVRLTLGSGCFDICFDKRKTIFSQRAYATNNLNAKKWECSGYASCGFYGNLKDILFVSLA